MDKSREQKKRWKSIGENREKERECVTTAITSSEMHLDRVSICQNKAASAAASLMAVDVSDREGRKDGWERQKILLHTQSAQHTTDATSLFFCSLLEADSTNHLIPNIFKATL